MVHWVENSAIREQETRRQQAFAQKGETERVMKIYREAIKYQREGVLLQELIDL